jgi:hypothetical protein
MKFFTKKPIIKPSKAKSNLDLSNLDRLMNQLPDNFAPTPKARSMQSPPKPKTPLLDHMLTIPSAKKPTEGIKVTGSSHAPAAIPSAAPAASTTASENRVAEAVLALLQKSLGKPGQTGLAPLLTAAAARHDATISAKLADQAKGQKVVPNSHLTGLQRLIANANAKNAPSSKIPNAPVKI